MGTKLQEAIKRGCRARAKDEKAHLTEAEKRAQARKKHVAAARKRVKADEYKLFDRVRRATRARCHSFTLSGCETYGRNWSPEEAAIVADAIEAEHPEFSTKILTEKSRDICEDLYDEGSIEISW